MRAALRKLAEDRVAQIVPELELLRIDATSYRERGHEEDALNCERDSVLLRTERDELTEDLAEVRPTLRHDEHEIARVCKCGAVRTVDLDAAAARILHLIQPVRVAESSPALAEVAASLLGECPECGVNDLLGRLGSNLSTEEV